MNFEHLDCSITLTLLRNFISQGQPFQEPANNVLLVIDREGMNELQVTSISQASGELQSSIPPTNTIKSVNLVI